VSGAVLSELQIADPPECWQALGFHVHRAALEVGGIRIALAVDGRGITAWSIHGLHGVQSIDGLPTYAAAEPPGPQSVTHPNGAIGIDQVVIATPDFDRTSRALESAQIPLRRTTEARGLRQGFRRLGGAILELIHDRSAPAGAPARFWGLVVIVPNFIKLGQLVGTPKPAVQPGRQIASVKREAGLSTRLAFMTPEAAEPAGAGRRKTPDVRQPGPGR
jgi:hypothetical protein